MNPQNRGKRDLRRLAASRKEKLESAITISIVLKLRELVHIIPKQDYLLVLEEAKYVVEDAVIGKVHDMIHFITKHDDEPKLNDGFEFQ